MHPADHARTSAKLWVGSFGSWSCGEFNLRNALHSWDDDQKEAFTRWVIRGARFF